MKLIISSSNKDKQQIVLTLALLAAAEVLDGSIRRRLAVSDRVITFVNLVKDKYLKCVGAIASTVASQVVSYIDPGSGKQVDIKFEYGQLSYYEDRWVRLYQLTKFDMTTSRSTGYVTIKIAGLAALQGRPEMKTRLPVGSDGLATELQRIFPNLPAHCVGIPAAPPPI